MSPSKIRCGALILLLGGVCAAAPPAPAPPIPLTLDECVALAVRNNLSVLLAKAMTESARGRVLQSASALLPHLTGQLSETRTFRADLRALIGFQSPELVGPWNDFEARVHLVLEVFDLPSILRLKSSGADDRASAMEERLAGEQVAAAATLSYVELFRARRAIASAEADLALATDLRRLAQDEKGAGVAAGIDVARAKTREAERKLALLEARNIAAQSEVRLQRVTGLSLDRGVALKDEPAFAPLEPPPVEAAIQAASQERWELRIASERLSAAQSQWRSEQAARLPSVVLTGDAGLSGPAANSQARTTGSAGAALQVPFFTGGAISGRVREADGRRAAIEAKLKDWRSQVEEDVRLALIDLVDAVERVKTSLEVERLAEDELAMGRDRFTAGVADNLELLNAQAALSHARSDRIRAMALYQTARVNLALSLGRMRDFRF